MNNDKHIKLIKKSKELLLLLEERSIREVRLESIIPNNDGVEIGLSYMFSYSNGLDELLHNYDRETSYITLSENGDFISFKRGKQ